MEADAVLQHEDKILLLLTLVIGAVVGLVVVAFILVTENLASRMYPPGGTAWRRLVLPVVGALGTGFVLKRYFPNARGSGIPQTKTALFLHDGTIMFRTAVGKFCCCAVSLASGIALGREGPSVQVAGGIASTLGRRLGLSARRVKALIAVGSAAAIAAAFNTPIAAVLFTLEEVMGDMHAPVLGSIVLSSATSWMVLHLILGDEPLFHVPAYQLVHPIEFALYALLGAAGGLVSVGFVKLLLWQRKHFLSMPAFSAWFQPAVGGLTVGVLGWFVPQVLGVGYGFVSQALNGQMVLWLMALLVILKVIATATCYASGNAGGIFGPSLFIGAMLGGAFGDSMHALMPDYTASVGAYALVGMGAAFAGIVRVPLASVIMIFEITRDYSIIVPLMIANLIAYFISSRLQPVSIYEALLEQDGIHLPPAARDREEFMTVGPAARPATEVLDVAESIEHAISRVSDDDAAWPVVQDGALAGMVTGSQLGMAMAAGLENEKVSALLPEPDGEGETEFPHIYVDDPADTAMRRMAQYGLKVLPVVSRADMRELKAVVSLRDIVAAYGLEGTAPGYAPVTQENRTTVRALVGTLAAVAVAIALAAFLTTFYRSARIARAQRDFNDGNVLMSRDHFEEAIEKFRGAVSVTHSAQHRLALAQALLSGGHLDEAQIYFSELLAENPNSGPANLGQARSWAQQNDIGDALRAYHRAIYGNWPSDPAAHRLDARLELVDVLGKAGRGDQARAELLSLKSEMASDPAVRKRVGHLLLTFGMPEEARAIFHDLVKSNRDDGESYAALGEAELATNRLTAAQSAFRSATRLEPANTVYSARAALVDDIVAMDPAARGLDSAQRYDHSRNLLGAALAAWDRCAAQSPGPTGEAADKARRVLQLAARPRSYSDAVDANVELAEQLWSERAESCGAPGPEEEALGRVMAEVRH